MVKVIHRSSQGIVQEQGTGFQVDPSVGLTGYGYLASFTPDAAPELSNVDAAAISVATFQSNLSTGGAETRTVAAGSVIGQRKKLYFVVDGGGSLVITITNPVSSALDIITFTNVGDTAELMWNGSAWRILALYNSAAGNITTPTVA